MACGRVTDGVCNVSIRDVEESKLYFLVNVISNSSASIARDAVAVHFRF